MVANHTLGRKAMATILMVDENPGTRQFFAEELVLQGHTVIAIGDGAWVDRIVRFSRLDLVILDLYMKGEHRWNLPMEIKRQDPSLPILLLTEFNHYQRDPRLSLTDGLLIKSRESAQCRPVRTEDGPPL
jgi:DNA-binding NtrC family response regulator